MKPGIRNVALTWPLDDACAWWTSNWSGSSNIPNPMSSSLSSTCCDGCFFGAGLYTDRAQGESLGTETPKVGVAVSSVRGTSSHA